MRFQWLIPGAVLILLGLGNVQESSAQVTRPNLQPPSPRPVYSPYLNLFRRGGTFTQNYLGIVRPELDFYQSIGQLERGLAGQERRLGDLAGDIDTALFPTGHRTSFLNTGGYFGGGGPGSASVRAAGARRTVGGPGARTAASMQESVAPSSYFSAPPPYSLPRR